MFWEKRWRFGFSSGPPLLFLTSATSLPLVSLTWTKFGSHPKKVGAAHESATQTTLSDQIARNVHHIANVDELHTPCGSPDTVDAQLRTPLAGAGRETF